MGGKSEQEGRSRIDHGRDRARYRATLRPGTLLLLDLCLWLALLGLLNLLARPTLDRLTGKGRGRPEGRDRNCTDYETPLHAAHVTTPSMNGK